MFFNDKMIAVIGMGYVGLPLAIALAKSRNVIGYDINQNRIKNLNQGIDLTEEVSSSQIKNSKRFDC